MLIVGGSGFIGRHLVRAAIENHYRPTVLSLHQVEKIAQIDGADYLVADISNYPVLADVLAGRKFSHVVNLGGYVDHASYHEGGVDVINTHFLGVQNLLRCSNWDCLESFIQIGSSDEYGNVTSPQFEAMREAPISPYSLAKVAAGQLLQMLYRTDTLPATVIRLFLVYGPEQNRQRFLPQVIKGCLYGDSFATSFGEQVRDFCYIDDVVNGILSALSSSKAHGEIVNIASGKPVKIRAIIDKVVDSVGGGEPRFGEIPYRTGENMSLYADISKARELLGWEPKVNLDDGLARTISFYRDRHE